MERRFQSILVDEPTQEQTLEILKGLRACYEDHHTVEITDEALEAAVSLSVRYIPDRFLPDKAIDLIDEAASRVRLQYAIPLNGSDNMEHSQEEREVQAVAIKNRFSGSDGEPPCVTKESIAQMVSHITGIAIEGLDDDQTERLLQLEEVLTDRIVRQSQAIEAVASAIRRSRVGLKDPERPVGFFVFLGPTGVGKTELCRCLADTLYPKQNALIRLDMSEYMERHAVAKLIGSPPGYVGFDDGGQLTKQVRRRPYALVLFDEIEKAYPDIWNILLQILDDGALTDSKLYRREYHGVVLFNIHFVFLSIDTHCSCSFPANFPLRGRLPRNSRCSAVCGG